MRFNKERRAVSDIVATLIMVAIVVGLGVLVFAFANNGLAGFSESYANAMSNQARALSEKFVVEQVAYTFPGAVALDGTSTNQVGGGSGSIATTLTTTNANDVVVAYVSPADTGSSTPPSVSGISGGSLTWSHRASTPAEVYGDYYVPVTLTNNQGTDTPSGFQQMVTINPGTYTSLEAADLGNLRFCTVSTYPCPGGDLLYSWLESCGSTPCNTASTATFWVNLGANVIAGSGGTLTVYIAFYSTLTTFDGAFAGEAPQLSATYGLYDNGAQVFTNYYRGDSVSGWTVSGTAGSTSSAPGGNPGFGPDALYANSANGDYAYINANIPSSPNVIIQSYVWSNGLGNLFYTANSAGAGTMTRLDTRGGQASGLALTHSWTSWNCPATSTRLSPSTWYLFTVDIAGGQISDSYSTTLSYGAAGTVMNTLSSTYTDGCGGGAETYSYNGGYVGVVGDALGSSYVTYWSGIIVRSYPPSGVMPSTSLGSATGAGSTFDLEEWYAVASSPLSSVSITATLSASDSAATWIAAFAISGANTTSPFDPNVSVPATSAGASPTTTMSTSNANDVLLYGCAAAAGGMASGFTSVFSNTFPPDQSEYVGYEGVSATQTNLATSCGTNSNGAEITDAVVASYVGADVYVRNVGTVSSTLVSVYVVDQSTGAFVTQVATSTPLNVGAVVDVPHSTVTFTPSHGHTYSFTVTSSLGNSVVYDERAT